MDAADLQYQRQRIFNVTASAIEALRGDTDPASVAPFLATLRHETEALFRAEEAAMRVFSFPGIDPHSLEHAWLRASLADLSEASPGSSDADKQGRGFADRFQREFFGPLVNHVQTLDREMNIFLGKV